MSQPANDEFSQHLSGDEESNHEDESDTGAAPKQQQQMEHYLEYIDNEVWKVIQNGNSKKRISTGKDGIVRVLSPVTAAEIQAVEKERKAKNILLMAIPKEHMRRFHGMDDAKEIWEAIRTRFGGNANSKKMQKAVFKQQFEAFKISNSEGLEKGYDRFQQLLSQLEAHGAEVSTEDANHKFLRSLPPAWSNLAMTMRTNPEIDTLSIDDLYNNLRVFEQEIQGASKTSSSAQNVAFVSQSKSSTNKVKSGFTGAYSTCTPSTSSTNIPEKEVLAGFADEVIYSLFAKQSEDWDLLHEDLEQIDDVDIEEMDINWQIAMIAIRMKKFYKKTGRRVRVDGKTPVGFDKKKLECFNCHNTSHFARECTTKGTHDGKKKRDSSYQHQEAGKQEKNQMGLLTMDDGIVNWGEHTEVEETNHALMAISSSNEVTLCSKTCIDSYNKLKTLCDEQMNQLGDQEAQILAYSQAVKKLEAQLVTFQKQQLSLNEKLTFQANEIYEKDEKLKRYRRIGMKAVKEKEQLQKTLDSWKDSSKNLWRLIDSGMSSNSKVGLGFEIQSNNEVLSYEEEMNFSVFKCSKEDSIGKPVYSRFTKTNDFKGVPHPLSGDYTPKPQEEIDDSLYVYGKKGPQKPEISVSDDNSSEHSTCQSNDSEGSCGNTSEHSFETESESLSVQNEMSTSRLVVTNEKVVSELQEVEPSCAKHVKTPRQPLKDKETHKVNRKNWNDMIHLIKDCDYYEKKMAREAEVKRVVNTGNWMEKPVWTKANRVNHSNKFVPRSVQLNAGRPNFNSVRPNINTGRTNINSVRPKVNAVSSNVNTVRSRQPNIHLKNRVDRGIVDCGCSGTTTGTGINCKQHRASCKAKLERLITEPLHTLHMDLFGPTSVKSINHASYCLTFIRQIENQLSHRVKIIRSDNGTEFKNRDMLEFCGNKREFKQELCNARTPQQNGVAERMNRTLIEAARTMLADSLLPTTFWAEAVWPKGTHRKNVLTMIRDFAPVARLEAIRLRGLCAHNPPGFVDLDLLQRFIKVVKALSGTAQAPKSLGQKNIMTGSSVCDDIILVFYQQVKQNKGESSYSGEQRQKPNLGLWILSESPSDWKHSLIVILVGSQPDRNPQQVVVNFLDKIISWQCKKQDNSGYFTICAEICSCCKLPRGHLMGTLEIHATIDTIGYTITEASIRDTLQLADVTRITMLPNDEIFEGMGQMGHPTDGTFTLLEMFFTRQLEIFSPPSLANFYNFSKLSFDGLYGGIFEKQDEVLIVYPRFSAKIVFEYSKRINIHPFLGTVKKHLAGLNLNHNHPHFPVHHLNHHSVQSPPRILLIPLYFPTPIPDTEPAHYLSFLNTPFEETISVPNTSHTHRNRLTNNMTMDDLLQVVLSCYQKSEAFGKRETSIIQADKGERLVKVSQEVKKLKGFFEKMKNLVLSDSCRGRPEALGGKSFLPPLKQSPIDERRSIREEKRLGKKVVSRLVFMKKLNWGKWGASRQRLQKRLKDDKQRCMSQPTSLKERKTDGQEKDYIQTLIKEIFEGSDGCYVNMKDSVLRVISRDDLTELYRIVMNRYGIDGPEDELEKVFWKYLKNMFEEPLSTDPIWSLLSQH
ncbi:ribonuclease H-like domain-containing protein [Tanacetum coccineum]